MNTLGGVRVRCLSLDWFLYVCIIERGGKPLLLLFMAIIADGVKYLSPVLIFTLLLEKRLQFWQNEAKNYAYLKGEKAKT